MHEGNIVMGADAWVFVGSLNTAVPHFAAANGRGIVTLHLDERTGRLTKLAEWTDVVNPTYLALSPARRLLFATSEMFDRPEGRVHAYRVAARTGQLVPLNGQDTGGSLTAHCSLDRAAGCVLVSNYTQDDAPAGWPGWQMASFAIGADGSLHAAASLTRHSGSGPERDRQRGPHAHCALVSPDNRYVLVADLGTDSLLTYGLDAPAGRLTPQALSVLKLAPGAGPRHLVFHPNGTTVYGVNELDATISRLAYAPLTGALRLRETTRGLPTSDASTPPADIHVDADGRHLYASFRGAHCIATYALDPRTGAIRSTDVRSSEGRTPRSFALSPSGNFMVVANQDSDSVVSLRIARDSGVPCEVVDRIETGTPMCVKAWAVD
ncbi:lactonase family protein [Robbsia sp. Bb-Pol-6]|uniref:Lactonase family protein n=1 Tax=Robbsia betulipollinis TaxID=2981849 RepID=A0ABT3ZSP0_9BURK|nr:lactonase family protein [Robbsia betulipollinis]MCY0389576.1 lactonase family protein [Robbsia betulipollinis]